MMISKAIAKRLNEQVNNEFFAFWAYQQMAYSFEDLDLPVFAQLFFKQAGEEREHAEKIAKYLTEQGAPVTLTKLDAPKSNYKSAADIIKAALDHELMVTKHWNDISDMAIKAKDHATRVLSDWFVNEQVEEVSSMNELLSMVGRAKTDGQIMMLEGRIWRMVNG